MNLPHGSVTSLPPDTYIYTPAILRVVKEFLKLILVVRCTDPNRTTIEYQMIDTVKESLRNSQFLVLAYKLDGPFCDVQVRH